MSSILRAGIERADSGVFGIVRKALLYLFRKQPKTIYIFEPVTIIAIAFVIKTRLTIYQNLVD